MIAKDILHGYPATSIGGKDIQRGRDLYDAGEPCPNYWPYLAQDGWYDRKKEVDLNTPPGDS